MTQVRTVSNSISSEFMKRSKTNRQDMITFWKPFESYGCLSQWYSNDDGQLSEALFQNAVRFKFDATCQNCDHEFKITDLEW